MPATCWFSNVRSQVSKEDWDTLRREAYREAEYICEICGGVGPKHPVECHEIWHYDTETLTQTLKGLTALCPNCHMCKHLGLAGIQGKDKEARAHLCKVNNWTSAECREYIGEVFMIWEERSDWDWKLDLSWLDEHGMSYKGRG